MIRNRAWAILLGVVFAIGGILQAAAQEATRSITISREAKVGAQVVNKGEYSIKFVEDKEGELTLLKGRREVVKVPYKLTKLDKPAPETVVIYGAGENGSFKLRRIELKGYDSALAIE